MDFIIRLAEEFFKKHKRLARYRRIFAFLAAVVVFATTYELILPAITMDRQRAVQSPGVEVGVAKDQRKGIDFTEDESLAVDTAGEDSFDAGFPEDGDYYEDNADSAGDGYVEDYSSEETGSADDWIQPEDPATGDTWNNASEIVPGVENTGDDYSGSDGSGTWTDENEIGTDAGDNTGVSGDEIADGSSTEAGEGVSGTDPSGTENGEADPEVPDAADGTGLDGTGLEEGEDGENGLEDSGSAPDADGQDPETVDGEGLEGTPDASVDSTDSTEKNSGDALSNNTQDASADTTASGDKSGKGSAASAGTAENSGEAVIEGSTAETAVEFAADGAAVGATDLTALGATGDQSAAAVTYPATIIYEGKDYTITATFDEKAKLPAEVTLSAVEILPNKVYKDENGNPLYADYEDYYEKTLEALEKDNRLENDQTVKSARFFDITFLDKDGNTVEPAASVSIAVKYKDALSAADTADTMAVHFEDNKTSNKAGAKADAERDQIAENNKDDSSIAYESADDKDNSSDKAETENTINTVNTNADITVPEIIDTKTEVKKKTIQEISFEAEKFSVYGVIGTEVITTRVITASGEEFEISVAYGPKAGIPEGAKLYASEILDEELYDYYMAQAGEAVEDKNGENNLMSARFFDVEIRDGEEVIEPKDTVTVTITYLKPIEVDETETLSAVHFGKDGIDLTEVSPETTEDGGTVIKFEQNGFSVTGTIITGNLSNGYYVIAYNNNGTYYALKNDGSATPVTVTDGKIDSPSTDIIWYKDGATWCGNYGSGNYIRFGSALVGSTPRDISVDPSGDFYKFYRGSSYLRYTNTGFASGTTNSNNELTLFEVTGTSNVYFIDRNGDPIPGVKNAAGEPVDSTTTLTEIGNTVDFSKFTAEGYSFSNVHINAHQQTIAWEDLVIEPQITNGSYTYSNGWNGGFPNNQAAVGTNDIYVIFDPDYNGSAGEVGGGSSSGSPVSVGDKPNIDKVLEDKGDGTYEIALSVTGANLSSTSPSGGANVILVLDKSSSMTQSGRTRFRDMKESARTLINTLSSESNNAVEYAVVYFDGSAAPASWNGSHWNTTPGANTVNNNDTSTVIGYINNASTGSGTNWEDGLKEALKLIDEKKNDSDPTYVVFLTDGEPTQYTNYSGTSTRYDYYSCYETARDEARAIVNAGVPLYCLMINTADSYLWELESYAYQIDGVTAANATTTMEGLYFLTDDTQGIADAFDAIQKAISSSAGFENITMTDKITDLTTLGVNSGVVGGDVSDFTYWRHGNVKNADGEVVSTYGTYDESSGKWTDAQWTAEDDPAPPVASYTDSDGVKWDLSGMDLENGITYTLRFVVWPNQNAYDIEADLNNGIKTKAEVEALYGSQMIITENEDGTFSCSVRTNPETGNTVTFTRVESATVEDESTIPQGVKDQLNASPVGTSVTSPTESNEKTTVTYVKNADGTYTKTTKTNDSTDFKQPTDTMDLTETKIRVAKQWLDELQVHDHYACTFYIWKDGVVYNEDGTEDTSKAYQTITLPKDGGWEDEIDIAPGLYKNGNVLETGHNYTVTEKHDPNYYYDFFPETVRPMLMGSAENITKLVLDDGSNVIVDGSETEYELKNVSGEGTSKYVVVSGGNYKDAIVGRNVLRGGINVEKQIVDEEGNAISSSELGKTIPDIEYTFQGSFYISGKEIKYSDYTATALGYEDGESHAGSDFMDQTDQSGNTYRIDGKAYPIWYQISDDGGTNWRSGGMLQSGETFKLKASQKVRFTNVPAGTAYSITEVVPEDAVYECYHIEGTIDQAGNIEWGDGDFQVSIPVISGSIVPNAANNLTYQNKYPSTAYTATKVWNDNGDSAGLRPDSVTLQLQRSYTIDDETTTENVNDVLTVGIGKKSVSTLSVLYDLNDDGEYTEGTDAQYAYYRSDDYQWIPTGDAPAYSSLESGKILYSRINTGEEIDQLPFTSQEPYVSMTPSEDGNTWIINWVGLEQYKVIDDNSYEYTYSVKEVNVDSNYSSSISENGSVITNTVCKKIRFRKTDGATNAVLGDAVFKLVIDGTEYTLTSDKDDDGLLKTTEDQSVFLLALSEEPYELIEDSPPPGYLKLKGVVEIMVSSNPLTPVTAGRSDDSVVVYQVTEEDGIYTVTITNSSGVELPMTGGSGTFIYTLSGITLLMAAALMYVFRMRRRERRVR